MHSIQIADQTFVAAAPDIVGGALNQPYLWRQWWPSLNLEVREARGDKGIRWQISGPIQGTMEVWLKSELDGVILHYFLHGEPAQPLGSRTLRRRIGEIRRAGKAMSFDVKSRCEVGKLPGHCAIVSPSR